MGIRSPGPLMPKVVIGDGTVRALVHRAFAQRAVKHRHAILDCNGVFDPYAVALEARRKGLNPEVVLERLLVCRAFTGYQELRALRNLTRLSNPHCIYLLNPLHVLLDEDLPRQDRPWLLNQVIKGLDWLSAQGHVVRICQQSVDPSQPEASRFQSAFTKRYPIIVATDGRVQAVSNGQVSSSVQPRHRQHPADVRVLPTRAA